MVPIPAPERFIVGVEPLNVSDSAEVRQDESAVLIHGTRSGTTSRSVGFGPVL